MVKLSKGIAPALIACAAAGWMAIASPPAQAATASGAAVAHHPGHVYWPSHYGPDAYLYGWRSASFHRPVYGLSPVHRFPQYRHVRWIHGRYYYQTRTGWHCLPHWYRR
ncbi:hypothetical protein GCM10009530_19190 [Microbispora corallina]|uniref:Uncharacterized protein n=1 Tax=Microbispora corallina TaxID=83302 RepID=A0ABQ4FUD2_9ACTN|nr:hypothetical protein Mco01_14220 [Microbispora corallina]